MFRRVLRVTLILPLVAIVFVGYTLLLPIILLVRLFRRRRWRRRLAGRLLFCYLPGRAYRDFITNNVLAVLPAGVEAVCCPRHDRKGKWAELHAIHELLGAGWVLPPRPFFLRLDGRRVLAVSVNGHLAPLKHLARRDPGTQQRVAKSIEPMLAELTETVGSRLT